MSSWLRPIALVTLAGLAWLAVMWRDRAQAPVTAGDERLSWVATAHQRGVVGYRDPVGAISPTGSHIAYSEGRHVRVVPIGGGAPAMLAAAHGQVRQLAWIDAATVAFEQTGAGPRWWTARVDREALTPLKVGADLRQIAWSRDGRSLAGVAARNDQPQIVRIRADGGTDVVRAAGSSSWPAWMSSTEVACLVTANGLTRLAAPCSSEPIESIPPIDLVGPIAVSPDAATVYVASPNDLGTVDLWAMDLTTRRARRVTHFARDTYAPSTAADGTVLFKTQSYRTFVADISGSAVRQLATFQSETPSWHPTRPLVAVTYGTWRRVVDDAKYPDIAQEIGLVDAGGHWPSTAPTEIIARSESEDQAMTWSPNGKWIALHSHREMSDDVWLRPADGSQPDRRITFLGRGAEVGWPRWSPDGTTILLDGASPTTGRSALFVIGVDQDSGAMTSERREVTTPGFEAEITHGEWMPDSRTIVAVAKELPGRHTIVSVGVGGGPPRVIHRFDSEHDFPGLAVSPDGRTIAFVAPATDGFFQIFRLPASGGVPEQVTRDPVHKTQPAFAPGGDRLAYTVWSYEAQFWTLTR